MIGSAARGLPSREAASGTHSGAACHSARLAGNTRRMATASSAPHAHASRPSIRSGALRAAVVMAGVGAVGLMGIPVPAWLLSVRGVAGPGVGDAISPVGAAVALLAAMVAFTAVGCVAGRLINAAVGLFVVGCGLAFITMRCGTIQDAAFDHDTLRGLAIETLVWAAVTLAVSAAVFRVSGPLEDIPAMEPGGPFAREVVNGDAMRGLRSGIVAVVVMWLLVRNDLKGQAIGCAVLAAAGSALAGRKLQGAAQPILLMAAPVLCLGAMQLWTAMRQGQPLDVLWMTNALPGWSRAMPMDIAAGALIGVPVGLGWSRSSTDE